MRKQILLLIAASLFPTTQSLAESMPCETQLKAAQEKEKSLKKDFDTAQAGANSELENDKDNYGACMKGTISFPEEHWVMNIPEFVMKDKKMSMDLPQVTMKNKEMIFHTPSLKCDTGVIMHQPVTVCESYKPLENPLPKCKVEMRPVIGTRCNPFNEEQKIIVGVPEVKIATTEWVIGIPEVTMKNQDWYFKTIKFDPKAGCIGLGCAEKCKDIMNNTSEKYSSHIGPASAIYRTGVATSYHDVNVCVRDTIETQRNVITAQYDAGINQLDISISTQKARGASDDQLSPLVQQREQMVQERAKQAAQLDEQIKKIDDQDKKMMEDATSLTKKN